MTSDLGTFIKEQRQRLQLTQGQLAARLRVDARTVRSWETGAHTPRTRLQDIQAALGIPLEPEDDNAREPSDQTQADPDRATLIFRPGYFAGLTADEREEALVAGRLAVLRQVRVIRRTHQDSTTTDEMTAMIRQRAADPAELE